MQRQMKRCSGCKKILPHSEFWKGSNQKDGLHNYCKTCGKASCKRTNKKYAEIYRARDRVDAKKTKQQCVDYKGGRCSICGYSKCLAALEFHHVVPEEKGVRFRKRRSIAISRTFNEKIKTELDKCILLCANCHREIENGGG